MDVFAALLPDLIDALPAREKSIVNAFYYERKSYGAIAEELKIAKGTVWRVCRDAEGMLRAALVEFATLNPELMEEDED